MLASFERLNTLLARTENANNSVVDQSAADLKLLIAHISTNGGAEDKIRLQQILTSWHTSLRRLTDPEAEDPVAVAAASENSHSATSTPRQVTLAHFFLGMFAQFGWLEKSNPKEAMAYFSLAWERDFSPALVHIGNMHLVDEYEDIILDFDTAVAKFKLAMERDDDPSAKYAYCMALKSRYLIRSADEHKLLQEAADQGCLMAKLALPYSGTEKVVKWIEVAKTGDARALTKLAILYKEDPQFQDPQRAAEYSRLAAVRGEPLAMALLAEFLLANESDANRIEEGSQWMKWAIALNDSNASAKCAQIYLGSGDPRDFAKAILIANQLGKRTGTPAIHNLYDPLYDTTHSDEKVSALLALVWDNLLNNEQIGTLVDSILCKSLSCIADRLLELHGNDLALLQKVMTEGQVIFTLLNLVDNSEGLLPHYERVMAHIENLQQQAINYSLLVARIDPHPAAAGATPAILQSFAWQPHYTTDVWPSIFAHAFGERIGDNVQRGFLALRRQSQLEEPDAAPNAKPPRSR